MLCESSATLNVVLMEMFWLKLVEKTDRLIYCQREHRVCSAHKRSLVLVKTADLPHQLKIRSRSNAVLVQDHEISLTKIDRL